MFAWIIGDGSGVQHSIADELRQHQFTVLISRDRDNPPPEEIDLCVDASATGVGDIKRMFGNFDHRATHYVLLSSCLVYPPVPRPKPWQEDTVDLTDGVGFTTLWASRRRLRASERELRYSGRRGIPWTILRPSAVESQYHPDPNSIWWMVSRILDGGPIVLPDNDEPLFSHVSDSDLARAVRIVALNPDSYFQTLNVTSSTFLTYDSYARRIMAVLDKKVPIVRVPNELWLNSGLRLPYERYIHSSFISESPLLTALGWMANDDNEWLHEHVQTLLKSPLAKPRQRQVELDLAKTLHEDKSLAGRSEASWSWCLTAQAGLPNSLKLGRTLVSTDKTKPLLRVLYHSLGLAEEMLLTSPMRSDVRVVLGHNVLLERLSPGQGSQVSNGLFLPVSRRPCGTEGCPICKQTVPGVSGITDDGYGLGYVTVPEQHLIPVCENLNALALLADPLACLISVIPPFLAQLDGPVWVFGERIEALLAMLLIVTAGYPVLHVGRTKLSLDDLPGGVQSKTIAQVEVEVREGSIDKAAMFINCSGSRDGENLLGRCLSQGGIRITPFDPTMPHTRRIDVNYPLVAPGRQWLEKALYQLEAWKVRHQLQRYISPLPLDRPSDLFITIPFHMRYLDALEGKR